MYMQLFSFIYTHTELYIQLFSFICTHIELYIQLFSCICTIHIVQHIKNLPNFNQANFKKIKQKI